MPSEENFHGIYQSLREQKNRGDHDNTIDISRLLVITFDQNHVWHIESDKYDNGC